MNIEISMNQKESFKDINAATSKAVLDIKNELDSLFVGKIKSPEQVIYIYQLLMNYKILSGTDYKITPKENTII